MEELFQGFLLHNLIPKILQRSIPTKVVADLNNLFRVETSHVTGYRTDVASNSDCWPPTSVQFYTRLVLGSLAVLFEYHPHPNSLTCKMSDAYEREQ